MSQSYHRPHVGRRLVQLPTITGTHDPVAALTGLALTVVVLLSVARCSSTAVSTLDAELARQGAEVGPGGVAALGADAAVRAVRPRPVHPVDPDGATGSGVVEATPPTFAAPPRHGGPGGPEPVPGAERAAPPGTGPAPSADGGAPAREVGPSGEGSADVQARLEELTAATGAWFGPDSTRIGSEARPVLDQVAELLRRHPDLRIEVSGHTDTNGSPEVNLELSQNRADAVREELILRGVEPGRVEAVGYGQTRPRQPNDTVTGRASNRRIELTVLD